MTEIYIIIQGLCYPLAIILVQAFAFVLPLQIISVAWHLSLFTDLFWSSIAPSLSRRMSRNPKPPDFTPPVPKTLAPKPPVSKHKAGGQASKFTQSDRSASNSPALETVSCDTDQSSTARGQSNSFEMARAKGRAKGLARGLEECT